MEERNNILITGISGFVGSHLASLLNNRKDENNRVVGIVRDMVPSKWVINAFHDCVIVQGDVRNKELVKRVVNRYDINQVYHLAASAIVKHAWRDPAEVFDTNVMGTVNLLEACREVDSVDKILVLNTDKIYGEKMNAVETDNYEVSEPYATSKICQGFCVKSWIKTYGMNIVMPSSCNIFGYDPFNNRIIPNVIKDCIRGNNPTIYRNDDSIREYIYVEDLVQALHTLMNTKNEYSTYNISTGYVYNQKEVIMNILENFPKLEAEYKEGDIPAQIQKQTLCSIHWDFKPKYTFDEGLKKTIEKFKLYEYDWI